MKLLPSRRFSRLSVLPLAAALLVACGGDEDTVSPASPPSAGQTGSDGGRAGAGGASAGAGQAGSGGSSAGVAGVGASSGTSGQGGVPAGMGGVASGGLGGAAGEGGAGQAGQAGEGSGQGGGGAGGGAGGQGGGDIGGQAGSASLDQLGASCESDAACGAGATCLRADGAQWQGGGPAGGLCVADCTAWLGGGAKGPDPCAGDGKKPVGACVGVGAKGVCLELCTQGVPAGMALDAAKCHGRADLACVSELDAKGVALRSTCQPQCGNDAQCGPGLQCDQGAGVCRPAAPVAKKTGELCDVTVGGCEGVCARLFDPSDPQTPVSKKNHGVCTDPCVFGVADGCGSASAGFCGLDVFTPVDPKTGEQGALGAGDRGGCVEVTTPAGDASCLWQEGWFATSIPGLPTLCLPARPCTSGSNTCEVGTTCQQVEAVCGRFFCVDHQVAGLPVKDPSVNCDPGQGG